MSDTALALRNFRSAHVSVRDERSSTKTSAIERYRLDPLRAVDEGKIQVWDPVALSAVPWEPYPNQVEDIVTWIDVDQLAEGKLQLHNTHVEKSRQVGDTTAFAYAALWVLTYWPVPLFMQHADLARVADSGFTYNSFFGKMKFMHTHWPLELGRAPLAFIGGVRPLIRRTDVSTGYMVGSGQSSEAARTGRYAGAIVDEAAWIVRDREIRAAMTSAVPDGEVQLSTPHGEGNVYFELRDERPRNWRFLRHHWTDHPVFSKGLHIAGENPGGCVRCAAVVAGVRYNPHDEEGPHRYPGKPTSPWYDDAILELTDEQVAQELDIDYTASLTARVYPEFDPAIHVVVEAIPWDPWLRVETYWDYGVHPTSVVICQEGPLELRVIGEVETTGLAAERVAEAVDQELRELGVDERTFGVRDTWLNIGDPAGEAKQIGTGISVVSQYAQAGFVIVSAPARIRNTIDSVKRLLGDQPKPMRISPRCEQFIAHMKGNRFKTDAQGHRRFDVEGPENDEHNHMMRAFAYGVHWKWPAPQAPEQSVRAADPYEDDSGKIDPGIGYGMDF